MNLETIENSSMLSRMHTRAVTALSFVQRCWTNVIDKTSAFFNDVICQEKCAKEKTFSNGF